ncbi:MAG: hypothetical protein AVDCRST_MAG68-1440, partial [uncultured Gemmatimonadetes bacterium]
GAGRDRARAGAAELEVGERAQVVAHAQHARVAGRRGALPRALGGDGGGRRDGGADPRAQRLVAVVAAQRARAGGAVPRGGAGPDRLREEPLPRPPPRHARRGGPLHPLDGRGPDGPRAPGGALHGRPPVRARRRAPPRAHPPPGAGGRRRAPPPPHRERAGSVRIRARAAQAVGRSRLPPRHLGRRADCGAAGGGAGPAQRPARRRAPPARHHPRAHAGAVGLGGRHRPAGARAHLPRNHPRRAPGPDPRRLSQPHGRPSGRVQPHGQPVPRGRAGGRV